MKYKLVNGWTKEKVMEQVRKYNNNTRSVNSNGTCVYRSEGGNRCAIGCFIPDDFDQKVFTYVGTGEVLIRNWPELRKLMPFDGANAITDFQQAHDQSCDGSSYLNVYSSIQKFLDEKVE